MSKKEEEKLINFSKSQMRRIAKQTGRDIEDITDEEFRVFIESSLGSDKVSGDNIE